MASTVPAADQTAGSVITGLTALADPEKIAYVARFYAGTSAWNRILGVPMSKVFPVAKAHAKAPLVEVEKLLEDPHYEVRMAAVSIMDAQAAKARLPASDRAALFDLYLDRHDRIDTWDLVDRAAPKVIGRYLTDKDRSPLEALAQHVDPWRRRSAIVATFAFLRLGETADTFRIAAILRKDPHPYVQKAVGSWLREAGKKDSYGLLSWLAKHSRDLPRTTLKTATSKLSLEDRTRLNH